MTFRPSIKGNNPNPCCTLMEFSKTVGIRYHTLRGRSRTNPLPPVQFQHSRGDGRIRILLYRVADLKKWLKDFDEKQKVKQ